MDGNENSKIYIQINGDWIGYALCRCLKKQNSEIQRVEGRWLYEPMGSMHRTVLADSEGQKSYHQQNVL